jgi:hypothetical protein
MILDRHRVFLNPLSSHLEVFHMITIFAETFDEIIDTSTTFNTICWMIIFRRTILCTTAQRYLVNGRRQWDHLYARRLLNHLAFMSFSSIAFHAK